MADLQPHIESDARVCDSTRWTGALAFGEVLVRAAELTPDRTGLAMPGQSFTYAELGAGAQRVARNLIGLGVGPGERVGVLMQNGAHTLFSLFGVALAGAVIVPINARYRAAELRFVLSDSGAVCVLTSDTSPALAERLSDALGGLGDAPDPLALRPSGCPALRSVIGLGDDCAAGLVDERRFDAAGATVAGDAQRRRRAAVGLRDPAMILYTSGTTADPRGARLSHESLVRVWGAVADALQIGPADLVWNPCPMFHIAAIGVCITCALHGAVNVTTRYFDAQSSIELLRATRPTVLWPAYSQILLTLLNHPDYDDACLERATRVLAVGGPDTLRGLQRRLPASVVMSTFGMTESCGCATMHSLDDDGDTRAETVGRPLAGLEARISDPETGAPMPPGEAGEIELRGPLLCDGYGHDAAATANAFTVDGWMRTGDQGVLDAEGRLAYRGRLKEMLRIGGENVSPLAIEAHLMSHPAVQLAQVVGVPDERLEEIPAAFVELRIGESASAEDLRRHCDGQIARFKVPRHWRFVEEWPMSATKVQKFRLREQLIAELRAGDDAPGHPAG